MCIGWHILLAPLRGLIAIALGLFIWLDKFVLGRVLGWCWIRGLLVDRRRCWPWSTTSTTTVWWSGPIVHISFDASRFRLSLLFKNRCVVECVWDQLLLVTVGYTKTSSWLKRDVIQLRLLVVSGSFCIVLYLSDCNKWWLALVSLLLSRSDLSFDPHNNLNINIMCLFGFLLFFSQIISIFFFADKTRHDSKTTVGERWGIKREREIDPHREMSGWLKNRETLNFSIIERGKRRERESSQAIGPSLERGGYTYDLKERTIFPLTSLSYTPHVSLCAIRTWPALSLKVRRRNNSRLSDDIQSNMNQ